MMATLKRLVDLSIVSRVLQNPTEYSDIHNGFVKDRAKLRGDFNTTVWQRKIHRLKQKIL